MYFNLGTPGCAVLRFVLSAQNTSHKNPYQNRVPVLIGFYCSQSRPSLWNPILRNLQAALALQITVREPGLRPCRAIAPVRECRCAYSAVHPIIRMHPKHDLHP
jgi:hypothetical protein